MAAGVVALLSMRRRFKRKSQEGRRKEGRKGGREERNGEGEEKKGSTVRAAGVHTLPCCGPW